MDAGTNVPKDEKSDIDNQDVINDVGTNVPELPDTWRLLKKLLELGASQRVIAKTFGVSHTTIQRYAKMIKEYDKIQTYRKE